MITLKLQVWPQILEDQSHKRPGQLSTVKSPNYQAMSDGTRSTQKT